MKRITLLVLMVALSGVAHADLKCGGTEPFWSIVIRNNKATYENMGEGLNVVFDAVLLQDTQGLKPDHTRKYTFKNAKTTADAVILKKKCDDGMSDIIYPYNITFTMMKMTFSGCCR